MRAGQKPLTRARSREIGRPAEPKTDRNKTVAALLAIVLGRIGLHKFYLGKALQGLLYLAFCWTFIPAVIGFFEGVGLLLMSEKAFAGRYPTR